MAVNDLVLTAARALAVYVLMLVVIRILGKRTVGNFSAFDLLIALMLGELVDEIIYGDVRFIQGTVAIVGLGALAYADAALAFRSDTFRKLTEGQPSVIVKDGEYQRKEMRSEHMTEQDVLAMLRHKGIQDMREVHLAVIEPDGDISVIRHSWAEPAQKADVDKQAAKERDETIGEKEDPPPKKRTDSDFALS